MPLAFGAVENGRPFKARLIGGAENAYSGHGANPDWKIMLKTNVSNGTEMRCI